MTPRGVLAALIGGGIAGLLGKVPGLDIALKEDLGLIGFAASAAILFGVSFFNRKRSLPARHKVNSSLGGDQTCPSCLIF